MSEKDIINIAVQVLDKGSINVLEVHGDDELIKKLSGGDIENLFRAYTPNAFKIPTITLGIKLPLFLVSKFSQCGVHFQISPKFSPDIYEPSEERLSGLSERNKGIFRNLSSSIGSVTDQAIRMDEKSGVSEDITQIHRLASNYVEIIWTASPLHLMNLFDKFLKQDSLREVELIDYIEVLITFFERWMPDTFHAYCKHRLNSISFTSWEISEISKHYDFSGILHDMKQAKIPEGYTAEEWTAFISKLEYISEIKNAE